MIVTSVGPQLRALSAALRAADVPDRYAATRALARRYAALLDKARGEPEEEQVYEVLGPKYLATLTALGLASGASRARGGATVGTGNQILDELRARRARHTTG